MKEIQKLSAEIVDKIDKKIDIKGDVQLNICQLMEELGELVHEIDREKLKNEKPERKALEGEFADVLILLANLAELSDIDLEKATLNKIEILKTKEIILF